MAYINVDDVVLHYEIYGQGAPVILLHGNHESMHYFHNQIPVLSAEYRVIAVDTRGHGSSTRGTRPFTFATFCQDLYLFMEALGIARAHLLGFSDGANTALYFSYAYPHKVAALLLNSPNLDPSGLLDVLLLQLKWKALHLNILAPFSNKAKRELELLELMTRQPKLTERMLHEISLNTLLIVGEKDMIKYSHFRKIAFALPHCVLKVIKGGTHFSAQQNPEIFNQEIMSFLRGFS